jgi:hypothetical protein
MCIVNIKRIEAFRPANLSSGCGEPVMPIVEAFAMDDLVIAIRGHERRL